MARLVDDLLDVSRITRGKITLRHEPVSLSGLIHRSLETVRSHMAAKQHDPHVSLPDDLVRIWADSVRLEPVLNNLLTNAVKYTDTGGVIEVEAETAGEEVIIRVRDNGIRIAPDMLEAVFGLFTQVDHSLAGSQGGLGIGLTLARNLMQMQNGTLKARSAGLGKGSEFIITLPLSKETHQVGTASPSETPRAAGSMRRVLVVDDNVASADSLGLIIRLWGHECRVVHSGPEAVEEAGVFRPDVVLLDIGLPGMDGYEVARELRGGLHSRSAVLIAMTGYGRDEDRRRALDAGFNEHLVKPLDLDALEMLLAQSNGPTVGPEAPT
jgi:CheY-like chemotaxis protein